MPHGVGARFFKSCDSTNAVAASLAVTGEPGPLWLIAGQQASGRGRRGRIWTSEPGNLYASLLLRPNLRPTDLAALPFIVALAVRDTFTVLGVPADRISCKWPNDVLIGGRKASGILIESSARSSDRLDYLVIGIGMNLAHFPDNAAFGATSLLAETGLSISVREAVSILADKLYARLTAWDVTRFDLVAAEWTAAAWGLGQKREIRTADDTFSGTLEGLSDDGGLIVRLDDGSEKRLYAGDVFPVAGI